MLVVENRAAEKLLLQRSSAKLVCADGTSLDPVSALVMYEQLRDRSAESQTALSGRAVAYENNDRKKTDWMI